MNDERELTDAFGDEAGSVIYAWAEQARVRVSLRRRLTNGKTGAPVWEVLLHRRDSALPDKRIIKVCPAGDTQIAEGEAAYHNDALLEAPEFARDHLVRLTHFLPVGNGQTILFQEVAGSRAGDAVPLANLADSIVEHPTKSDCSAEVFAGVCHSVVRSVLGWKLERLDALPVEQVDVPAFLQRLLQGRLEAGGSVHRWAAAEHPDLLVATTRWIDIDGDILPNPVALASDPSFAPSHRVEPLCGPVHGDLHEENILICLEDVRAGRAEDGRLPYWLIDLSRYMSQSPLAYDPMHLLLSLAGRHLSGMPDWQRIALVRFLVDPRSDNIHGSRFPGWLSLVVKSIWESPPAGLDRFMTEWREQSLLSMVVGGLVFAARRSTPDDHRDWYLRASAHAAGAFVTAARAQSPHTADASANPSILITSSRAAVAVPELPERLSVEPSPTPAYGQPVAGVIEVAPAVAEPGVTGAGGPATSRGRPDKVRRTSLGPADRRLLDKLASRVVGQWRAAAEGRRLDEQPIPIWWARTSLPVVGPLADALGAPGFDAGPLASSADAHTNLSSGMTSGLFERVYSRLRRGRLVILGDEGSGKTSAAIMLLLDIIDNRRFLTDIERAQVPVPVILTPHDWDPEKEKVRDWLARRLIADYPQLDAGPRDAAAIKRLVKQDHIALFLDGLDDMAERSRAVALQVLDRRAGLRIVLLSNSADMVAATAGARLRGALAVELQQVEPRVAADYLVRSCVEPLPPQWQRLVDHIRATPDSPVTQALNSPLMLGLVRNNYGRDDEPDELMDRRRFPEETAIEEHLLKNVLPAAYQQQPAQPPLRYQHEYAERRLGYLAQRMRQHNTRELAWWDLPRYVPKWLWLLAAAVLTGLFPALLFACLGYQEQRVGLGFLLGMAFGPAAVLFDAGVVHDRQRGGWATRFRIAVGYLLTSGVAGGVAGGLVTGTERGGALGLGVGLALGAVVGVPAVMIAAWRLEVSSRPSATSHVPLRPDAYWHQDRRHSAIFGAVLGSMVGLTLALVCAFVDHDPIEAAIVGPVGAASMFVFAIMLSLRAKAKLAAFLLWVRRRAPFKLLPFLEDARKRNVLRSAGPVYQFRHARLQDVLADQYESRKRRRRFHLSRTTDDEAVGLQSGRSL